ncbi:hypothetical protein OXPF_37310 [Oxobacter pfennigii]|uniref:Uncharacterized protein n=1 Tax=Oxobacter pfennigii TaxID=36849 RepID=A0A0P8W5M5_9CLOT|nr:DUF4173 domain-containing protein [Oxobacter pfennigii]KPU42962.1 hypothetical protein OXPF_37310 [Oxobacter pfennigii]
MSDDNVQYERPLSDEELKRAEEEGKIGSRDRIHTVIFAFLVGMAFDYLFYDKYPGLSFTIFGVLLMGFFFYSARERINYKRKTGWFVLAVIFLLSSNFAIRSNSFLATLNALCVPLLTVAYTILVTNEKPDWSKPSFIIKMAERIFYLSFLNVLKPFIFLKQLTAKKEKGEINKTRRSILIGLLASLPVLIFVVPLLSSADMVFNHYIRNMADIFDFIKMDNLFIHIILTGGVFLYVFGYAWSFKFSDANREYPELEKEGNIDPTVIITMLGVMNAVYLLFTIIQFSYLYGGAEGMVPQGFTYAEYARRGFFELVAVTMINFAILITAMRVAKNDNIKLNRVLNGFLSALVIFTCNMLFSAHYKMSMYEEAYGYTELRIYVHIFMLLMFILFILAMVKIWHVRFQFFKVSFTCAVLIYVALNFMNVHSIIARNNIERYYATGNIDIMYLLNLSYDSVPQVVELMEARGADFPEDVKVRLREKYNSINRDYKWMEYNYSVARAQRVLGEYFSGE